MAKFKTSNSKFCIVLSGKDTTDTYYTSLRIEVKGCITKPTDLNNWQESIFYGSSCYLPENKKARRFIKEYINGKCFAIKYMRHINASKPYESKEKRKELFDNMLNKINYTIDNSWK